MDKECVYNQSSPPVHTANVAVVDLVGSGYNQAQFRLGYYEGFRINMFVGGLL